MTRTHNVKVDSIQVDKEWFESLISASCYLNKADLLHIGFVAPENNGNVRYDFVVAAIAAATCRLAQKLQVINSNLWWMLQCNESQ